MISENCVHEQINVTACLLQLNSFKNHVEKVFHNNNRRHVYNVKNFVHIKNDVKNQITQFFSHIYRRHIYCFVIVNKVKIIDEIINEIETIKHILNSVLDFLVYRLVVEQDIYDLSTLTNDFFYFITASHELDWQKQRVQYLLKCDWSVAYL